MKAFNASTLTPLGEPCPGAGCSTLSSQIGVEIPGILCPSSTTLLIPELGGKECKGGMAEKTCYSKAISIITGREVFPEMCSCNTGCLPATDKRINVRVEGFKGRLLPENLLDPCECDYCSMIFRETGKIIPELFCANHTMVTFPDILAKPCDGGCSKQTCHCIFYQLILGIEIPIDKCHCILVGCTTPTKHRVEIIMSGFREEDLTID